MIKSILLVEPDGNTKVNLIQILNDSKYEVCSFSNMKDSFEFLKENRIDLMIVDYNHHVSEDPTILIDYANTHNIPVFIMTTSNRTESCAFNINDIIHKPFDIDNFLKKIVDIGNRIN